MITVPKNEAMLSGKSIVSSTVFETCPAKIIWILRGISVG
jgi:hypothetical protein